MVWGRLITFEYLGDDGKLENDGGMDQGAKSCGCSAEFSMWLGIVLIHS